MVLSKKVQASDKSFSYGQSIIHKIIEEGGSYKKAKDFLIEEKNFSPATIDRMIDAVKSTRCERAENDEEESQPEDKEQKEDSGENEEDKEIEESEEENEKIEEEDKEEEKKAANIKSALTSSVPNSLEVVEADEVISVMKDNNSNLLYLSENGGVTIGPISIDMALFHFPFSEALKRLEDEEIKQGIDSSLLSAMSDEEEIRLAYRYMMGKSGHIVSAKYVDEKLSSVDKIIKEAQSPSPWEPNVTDTVGEDYNNWFNWSWEGILDHSRQGKETSDFRDTPLDTRMWEHHGDESPQLLLENQLSEDREVVKPVHYEDDNYWAPVMNSSSIEGRMVELGLNDNPDIGSGDIPQLEKNRKMFSL